MTAYDSSGRPTSAGWSTGRKPTWDDIIWCYPSGHNVAVCVEQLMHVRKTSPQLKGKPSQLKLYKGQHESDLEIFRKLVTSHEDLPDYFRKYWSDEAVADRASGNKELQREATRFLFDWADNFRQSALKVHELMIREGPRIYHDLRMWTKSDWERCFPGCEPITQDIYDALARKGLFDGSNGPLVQPDGAVQQLLQHLRQGKRPHAVACPAMQGQQPHSAPATNGQQSQRLLPSAVSMPQTSMPVGTIDAADLERLPSRTRTRQQLELLRSDKAMQGGDGPKQPPLQRARVKDTDWPLQLPTACRTDVLPAGNPPGQSQLGEPSRVKLDSEALGRPVQLDNSLQQAAAVSGQEPLDEVGSSNQDHEDASKDAFKSRQPHQKPSTRLMDSGCDVQTSDGMDQEYEAALLWRIERANNLTRTVLEREARSRERMQESIAAATSVVCATLEQQQKFNEDMVEFFKQMTQMLNARFGYPGQIQVPPQLQRP